MRRTVGKFSRVMLSLLLTVSGVATVGCQTTKVLPPDTYRRGARIYCVRHRSPLLTVPAFEYRKPWPLLSHEPALERLFRRNPNGIGHGYYSLKRSATYPTPTQIDFCARCEEAYQKFLARFDQVALPQE